MVPNYRYHTLIGQGCPNGSHMQPLRLPSDHPCPYCFSCNGSQGLKAPLPSLGFCCLPQGMRQFSMAQPTVPMQCGTPGEPTGRSRSGRVPWGWGRAYPCTWHSKAGWQCPAVCGVHCRAHGPWYCCPFHVWPSAVCGLWGMWLLVTLKLDSSGIGDSYFQLCAAVLVLNTGLLSLILSMPEI